MLKEREAKVNIQYAKADEFKAFELQSAFALSSHIGGMVNFLYGSSSHQSNSLSRGSGQYAEVAGGYFNSINSSVIVFEAFGGIGTGGIENIYSKGDRSKVTFTKLFIQPDIGIKVKGFEFGLSSKFSSVKHKINSSKNADQYGELLSIREHPNSFLWEPGIVLRAGGEHFLVQLQYTWSRNLTNPTLKQEPGIFNIGFSIPIKYKSVTDP